MMLPQVTACSSIMVHVWQVEAHTLARYGWNALLTCPFLRNLDPFQNSKALFVLQSLYLTDCLPRTMRQVGCDLQAWTGCCTDWVQECMSSNDTYTLLYTIYAYGQQTGLYNSAVLRVANIT